MFIVEMCEAGLWSEVFRGSLEEAWTAHNEMIAHYENKVGVRIITVLREND